MAAEYGVGPVADAAAKKPEENGVSAHALVTGTEGKKQPDCISSVIPGWFSEISPMWPGEFFFSNLIFSSFVVCLAVEIC